MARYPSVEDITEINAKVISEIKVKKADKHIILSKEKIETVLKATKNRKGGIYDKAVVLLKGLMQKHPFASGNRRTAFVTVENFLLHNGEKPKVNKDANASVMQGIREDHYSDEEIKFWLQGGDIREFKR